MEQWNFWHRYVFWTATIPSGPVILLSLWSRWSHPTKVGNNEFIIVLQTATFSNDRRWRVSETTMTSSLTLHDVTARVTAANDCIHNNRRDSRSSSSGFLNHQSCSHCSHWRISLLTMVLVTTKQPYLGTTIHSFPAFIITFCNGY